MFVSDSTLAQMRKERGPRWLVYVAIHPGEYAASYAVSADHAEKLRQKIMVSPYPQLPVVLRPDELGSVSTLALAVVAAQRRLGDALEQLQAGVSNAAQAGRTAAEIAEECRFPVCMVEELLATVGRSWD